MPYLVNRNDLKSVCVQRRPEGGFLVKARCEFCRTMITLRLSATDIAMRTDVLIGCSSGLDDGSSFQLAASFRPEQNGFKDGVSVWGNVYCQNED